MRLKVKTKCYNHQLEALNYGMNNPRFLLADEQGLGKTKESIDIACNRYYRNQIRKCLIICGVNSTKYNWYNEILIHSDMSGVVVDGNKKEKVKRIEGWNNSNELFCIINIESLRIEEVVKVILSSDIDMVILDEAHKCKNSESIQGRVIHIINSRYRIALTGTPIHNRPMDVYNILKWLGVEGRNFYSFRNRYCILNNFKNVIGYKNMSELENIVDRKMLRRIKDEVLDLPQKIYISEYVKMTEEQRKLYSNGKESIIERIKKGEDVSSPLSDLLNMRKVANGLGLKSSPKLDRLKELILEAKEEGRKVIIFSNYKESARMILEGIEGIINKRDIYYIDGDVKVKKRQEQVDEFQEAKCFKVILGTIGAMGTGLTLNTANDVIFFDKHYNPSENKQAEDRSHRIGTKGNVNIISLLCMDSIDIKIEKMLKEKENIIEILLKDNNRLLKYILEV